jgi:ADP-ribosylglycohydrolase
VDLLPKSFPEPSETCAVKTILLLEDNQERCANFIEASQQLGEAYELKIWRDAHSMCAECETFFPTAALICLDHDLNPMPSTTADPGTGLDVARFLGDFLPVCPVLLHSSNTDRVYSMHNELRFAGWTIDHVGPLGARWIESSWLPRVREVLAKYPNTWNAALPTDHAERVERMLLSLDGLSIGDGLGEMLAYRAQNAPERLKTSDLPAGPWFHTDDTEMAISIVAVLKSHGHVHQDALSKRFVRRFERDRERGYGKMTRIQLRENLAGKPWQVSSAGAFGGRGSMGNGGAMRVAPLGAYFADDLKRVAKQAQTSSVVTHVHPEGVAGTVAAALAAAMAWELRSVDPAQRAKKFFEGVLQHTSESEVRRKVLLASQVPQDAEPEQAANALGRGDLVTAPDTIPFCLWVAAHHLDNFAEALSVAISVGGDCDTNAAIVGGIVALSVGREGIPPQWMEAREPIRF